MSHNWLDRSIPDIATAVRTGEIAAEALATVAVERIRKAEPLNAFIHVAAEQALQQAVAIDKRRSQGEPLGALAGVPIALKDALCTRDQPTTAGSAILTRDGSASSGYRPPYDAAVVERLRAADAVLLGKCNMDEFAMGSSNENSAFGVSHNPWDLERIPGGSSGGSAVAVAAALVAGSLGSDTGGSVRQPAALCGCVGLKPSYGRVSRYGLIAFASSLDQIGPLARDVRGAAQLLQTIAGHDSRDATSAAVEVPSYVDACRGDVDGLRIGIPTQYFGDGLHDEVRHCVDERLAALQQRGARLVPIELPHTEHALSTYYILATAECSSNLSRFDGVRYALRKPGKDIDAMYRNTRSTGFGAEVKRRIMLGTYVLSAGYYEAYYCRAQRVRALLAKDFEQAFGQVDIIATPVSPTVAFRLGERTADPLTMYLADVFTLPASLAGIAAISLPCGLGSDSNMPIGLQLCAPAFGEVGLLNAAQAVEDCAQPLPLPPFARGYAQPLKSSPSPDNSQEPRAAAAS